MLSLIVQTLFKKSSYLFFQEAILNIFQEAVFA